MTGEQLQHSRNQKGSARVASSRYSALQQPENAGLKTRTNEECGSDRVRYTVQSRHTQSAPETSAVGGKTAVRNLGSFGPKPTSVARVAMQFRFLKAALREKDAISMA